MWVAVDPELLIAGEVSVEAPVRMLQKQLRNGSSARIRWTAAEALGLRDEPTTIAALEASLADEKELWMVCAEAATALGRIGGRQSFGACARHLGVRHPKVRRAVVAALGNFRSPEALRALRSVAARDASYLVEAEACRSAGRTRQSGALTVLQSSLRRKSWADVVRVGALDGLSQLNDDRAVGPVRQRTLYGVGDRERRAAIAALSRLSNDRKVRQHLEDLLEDSDAHVRQDVASALQTIGDVRAVPALRRQLEREQDGRAARQIREALRNMDASDARLRLELRDELEAMRGEIGELRTRLGKIEASLRAKQVQKESQSRGRPTARTRVTGHRTARRIRRKT
jgi:aminopeptidase N